MKKNLGFVDRIVRVLIAAIIIVLIFTNVLTGTVGLILLIVSATLVLTSLLRFCPLYAFLDVDSCSRKEKASTN